MRASERSCADASVARSGETLRQGEWRDELLRTGIRGKAGQHIRFARLEPLPGAAGCTPTARPAQRRRHRSVREDGPAYMPSVPSSPSARSTPRWNSARWSRRIEEAQTLVPKPKLLVFAAFQFDPEAAKDIDETKWPGVTLLKVQMNADLLTDDLKKKRASNESFWLIGQPDVRLERKTNEASTRASGEVESQASILQHQDRRHRVGRRGQDCRLAAGHRL